MVSISLRQMNKNIPIFPSCLCQRLWLWKPCVMSTMNKKSNKLLLKYHISRHLFLEQGERVCTGGKGQVRSHTEDGPVSGCRGSWGSARGGGAGPKQGKEVTHTVGVTWGEVGERPCTCGMFWHRVWAQAGHSHWGGSRDSDVTQISKYITGTQSQNSHPQRMKSET